MFLTLRITAALLLAASFISFAFPGEKLCKHWISEQSFLDASRGDTLRCKHSPYDYELYTWGTGILSGIEFKADGGFELHHNVMCSTESSTITFEGKWYLLADSAIYISAPGRHANILKIVSLNNKELVLIKR